jgi:uncharacterized protein YkwD
MNPNQRLFQEEEAMNDPKRGFMMAKLMDQLNTLFILTNEKRHRQHLRPLKWDDFMDQYLEGFAK